MAPVILTDLDDTLFQTMPKCPPGATDLRQMSSLMDGSASGFATKLQQNFLAWLEAGLVVPVTARGRDVLARVNIPSSPARSEEQTSELQSLMRISYAVFCLTQQKTHISKKHTNNYQTYHILLSLQFHIIYL